jgi:hypothetical protein
VKICPKLEGENQLSEKFLAELEFRKIDPRQESLTGMSSAMTGAESLPDLSSLNTRSKFSVFKNKFW